MFHNLKDCVHMKGSIGHNKLIGINAVGNSAATG